MTTQLVLVKNRDDGDFDTIMAIQTEVFGITLSALDIIQSVHKTLSCNNPDYQFAILEREELVDVIDGGEHDGN